MFGFLPCVLRFCATVFNTVIVFVEVASLHDFVEEELTFVLVRLADEVFVWHSKDRLEDILDGCSELFHAESGENVHDFLI